MNAPKMHESHPVNDDTTIFPGTLPVPGFGTVPINAFLIHGKQPVLVDTNMSAVHDDFMHELEKQIDLEDIEWLWLTHTDPDHTGSIVSVLNEAPRARVVTTFVGMAKMSLQGLPIDRVYLLNPGQTLDIGDRRLTALRPPTFDAPETTCLFDSKTRTFISADSFGAMLGSVPDDAEAIGEANLRAGMGLWLTIDSPWLESVNATTFGEKLNSYRKISPDLVLSSHLPPAGAALFDTMLEVLRDSCGLKPFVGPDQEAFEEMMARAAPAPSPRQSEGVTTH